MTRYAPAYAVQAVALAAGAFIVLWMLELEAPALVLPAAAACIIFVVLLVVGRALRSVHVDVRDLQHTIRGMDAGLIGLEHAHQPLRLAGEPIDIEWDRGMVTPELAEYLLQLLLLMRPSKVLECGAGASTRIISRCLKLIGQGRLITLEHDAYWATTVSTTLQHEGLTNAEVRHAPLTDLTLGGRHYQWYGGLPAVLADGPFDVIFVDGPPGARPGDPGREAALYALFDAMRPGAIMLVDDGSRAGERAAARRWQEEFGEQVRVKFIGLGPGVWLVEKLATGNSTGRFTGQDERAPYAAASGTP